MTRQTEQSGDPASADDDAPNDPARASHAREASRFDSLELEDDDGFAHPDARSLPQPGDIIAGKYRVEEQLGHGGMGAVFGATHLVSGKHVALKWMLRSSSRERERSRFVREARVAARVDHPNVVDVYDIGQDGDRGLYLVMQLLRGESLAARIDRERIAIADTVDFVVQAMRGVAAVHAAGVIHRDLKPDNIFLCGPREDGSFTAKVLDFGISAVTGRDGADVTLTREGAILGTPCYMSPEQLRDSRAIDVRADVYAFGVILYEALTGEVPFRSNSHNGLVLEIFTSRPASPRTLRAEVPPGLARVVLRALEKDREARFANMDAMIEALMPFGTRGALPPRKPWLGWVLAVSSVALLVLVGATLSLRAAKPVAIEPVVAPAPVQVATPVPPAPAPSLPDEPIVLPEKPPERAPSKPSAVRRALVMIDAGTARAAEPPGAPEPRKSHAARSGTIRIEDI